MNVAGVGYVSGIRAQLYWLKYLSPVVESDDRQVRECRRNTVYLTELTWFLIKIPLRILGCKSTTKVRALSEPQLWTLIRVLAYGSSKTPGCHWMVTAYRLASSPPENQTG